MNIDSQERRTEQDLQGISALGARILAAAPEERRALAEEYLKRRVAATLNSAPEDVPIDESFLGLGLDSLMLMDVSEGVRRDLDLTLYIRELFDQPSIEAMAKYIVSELDGRDKPSSSNTDFAALERLVSAPSEEEHAFPARRLPSVALLLSSPRSGSTLLRVMLAGHSALFCPPELHLLPFASMRDRQDRLDGSYLGEGLTRAIMALRNITPEEAKAMVDDLVERNASIYDVYNMVQQAADGKLLVDKSPSYAFSSATLARAERLFEKPKYIHLVRHPYSTIESIVRNRMDRMLGIRDVDPNAFAETAWELSNRNVRDFLQGIDPERQYLVRFEELVRYPRRVMSGLCAFLGVPFEEATLEPYQGNRMTDGLHAKTWGTGDPSFMSHDTIEPALGDTWQRVRLSRPLGPAAKRLAEEFSYDTGSETDPPSSGSNSADSPCGFEEGRL